jgi:hypothetical protein
MQDELDMQISSSIPLQGRRCAYGLTWNIVRKPT